METSLAAAADVPTIDLAADPLEVARRVRAAGHATGLFAVVNHGVPQPLIDAHFAFARAFFALDLAEKLEIEVEPGRCFRGYEPLGSQTIDAAAPGDLKEGFIMGPDLAPDHPHVVAGYPNTGANRWPRRPAGMRAHFAAYVGAMNALGRRIAAALATSLDVPGDFFAAALAEPLTYAQLFHYPPVPPGTFAAHHGAGAHVDWGLLTILLQDDVGGLEVRGDGGDWYAVPPVPGSFVIIFGELVVRLTGGRYRSATHRVRKNTTGRSRYSMPTFFDPAYDARIGCVPTCRPATGEPRYAACTVAEHMRAMARAPLSAAAPNASRSL